MVLSQNLNVELDPDRLNETKESFMQFDNRRYTAYMQSEMKPRLDMNDNLLARTAIGTQSDYLDGRELKRLKE